jgi:hypothetical protein
MTWALTHASARVRCKGLPFVGKWLARCYIAEVLANAT